jgi:hypothetical protein
MGGKLSKLPKLLKVNNKTIEKLSIKLPQLPQEAKKMDFQIGDDVIQGSLETRIALVEQARLNFGNDFARGLWIATGLPTVGKVAAGQCETLLAGHVDRFIAECLNPDPLSEVRGDRIYSERPAGACTAPPEW